MKVIAFAASNSRQSINKALATYTAHLVQDAVVEVLDLNDFELPIYSIDQEQTFGIPKAAHDFHNKINDTDALVISFAEHNGSYSAVYKNLFDWMSRIQKGVFANKPAIYLSASPGPGGAQSVLNQAIASASFFQADVKASLSVARFHEVFDQEKGRPKTENLEEALQKVADALSHI